MRRRTRAPSLADPDGHGSIEGHIEMRVSPMTPETVMADGARVFLVPAISYTKWYFMNYLTGAIKHRHGTVNIGLHHPRLTFERFADSVMRYTLEKYGRRSGPLRIRAIADRKL